MPDGRARKSMKKGGLCRYAQAKSLRGPFDPIVARRKFMRSRVGMRRRRTATLCSSGS